MESLIEQLVTLWGQIELEIRLIGLPSRLWQLGLLAACLLGAVALRALTFQRMRDWMRGLEGWPKWRLRALLVVNRRLGLIWFAALAGLATAVMGSVHAFPSRTYILTLVSQLALALLAVAFVVQLVRNPTLRRFVRWVLWIYLTLHFLGVRNEVARIFDSIAIEIGTFRLSVLTLISGVVLIGVLFTGARALAGAGSARIRRNDDISPSLKVLAVKVLQLGLFGTAFFFGLKTVGVDLTGLAVLSGAIGVGLGFGLQKVVSNLVSGVIILLDKSIKPGDVISLGETFGWINTLGARYASITTRDGREYLVPNEDLITGQVVNWSHSDQFVRLDIFFGTAYADDPHRVRRIAVAAASSLDRVLSSRPPVCHIVGFGDSSVDYILRFWIIDPSRGLTNIRGDVYLALWDAFEAENISIPFPQREVRVMNEAVAVAMRAGGDGSASAGSGEAPVPHRPGASPGDDRA